MPSYQLVDRGRHRSRRRHVVADMKRCVARPHVRRCLDRRRSSGGQADAMACPRALVAASFPHPLHPGFEPVGLAPAVNHGSIMQHGIQMVDPAVNPLCTAPIAFICCGVTPSSNRLISNRCDPACLTDPERPVRPKFNARNIFIVWHSVDRAQSGAAVLQGCPQPQAMRRSTVRSASARSVSPASMRSEGPETASAYVAPSITTGTAIPLSPSLPSPNVR